MTIIKQTRLKFTAATATIVFAIVFAFCASILVSTYSRNATAAHTALAEMLSNFGVPDRPGYFDPFGPAPPNSGYILGDRFNYMRGFTVKLNSNFDIIAARYSTSVFTESEITEYVAQIHQTGSSDGKIGDLQFLTKASHDGKIIACLDTSVETAMFNGLLRTVLLAGGSGMFVLLVLIWLLSYWIVKPAAEAFQKQKRFISEAGHELKTPLTVISASLELLLKSSSEDDKEKLLKNIQEQSDKMRVMASELLALSKIDENVHITKTEFDLSQTVLTESLAFESVAFENGKTLLCETDEKLVYKGNHQAVRQAVGILCDNAIKHSSPNGTIYVQLKKQTSKLIFSVSNTSDTIDKDEIPLIFARFYRGSKSRASSSGTGLGLAILKTHAEQNGWTTNATIERDRVTFSIIF